MKDTERIETIGAGISSAVLALPPVDVKWKRWHKADVK